MKHLSKNALTIILSITLFACNENEQTLKDQPNVVAEFNGIKYTQNQINNELSKINNSEVLKKFNSHFGINSIRNIEKNTSIFKSLGLSKYLILTEYSYKNSLEKIYITQNFDNTIYQFFKVNLFNDKVFIIKGFTFEVKNNEIQSIRSIENIFLNRNADPDGEWEWCQQEEGDNGSASACSSREYDEFTEDWVGFIAFWSNPQIAILIAAMCSC
ncbi:MAG: hypothetical protein V3V28_12385 [Polaribacter sp.]|uniref:hypothetical protein n=1 Tax=Polaribacter sp. TaxID=1920175 RepID=UPI002F360272